MSDTADKLIAEDIETIRSALEGAFYFEPAPGDEDLFKRGLRSLAAIAAALVREQETSREESAAAWTLASENAELLKRAERAEAERDGLALIVRADEGTLHKAIERAERAEADARELREQLDERLLYKWMRESEQRAMRAEADARRYREALEALAEPQKWKRGDPAPFERARAALAPGGDG